MRSLLLSLLVVSWHHAEGHHAAVLMTGHSCTRHGVPALHVCHLASLCPGPASISELAGPVLTPEPSFLLIPQPSHSSLRSSTSSLFSPPSQPASRPSSPRLDLETTLGSNLPPCLLSVPFVPVVKGTEGARSQCEWRWAWRGGGRVCAFLFAAASPRPSTCLRSERATHSKPRSQCALACAGLRRHQPVCLCVFPYPACGPPGPEPGPSSAPRPPDQRTGLTGVLLTLFPTRHAGEKYILKPRAI